MKRTHYLIIATAALFAACAAPAVEGVFKNGGDNTLTEPVATGAQSLTISATGTFQWETGASFAGAAGDMRNALGLGTLSTQNGTITDYLLSATAATLYQPLIGAGDYFAGPVTQVSAATNLFAGHAYLIDGDTDYTVTLPASPVVGDRIKMVMSGTWNCALTIDRNGEAIGGSSSDPFTFYPLVEGKSEGDTYELIYKGGTTGWANYKFATATYSAATYYSSGNHVPVSSINPGSTPGVLFGAVDGGFGLVNSGLVYPSTGLTMSGASLNLANTTVTAGSYTLSNVTVDAQGRITAASSTPLATQAEAEAGTSSDKMMTPERTAQAIAALAGGGHSDVQVFLTDGTWTKPAGAVSVDLIMVGGGGGGSSGARGANGTSRLGGGGGGGAGCIYYQNMSAATFDATEAVTVGAGGAGGAGVTADDTVGNRGTAGATSTFGDWHAIGGGVGATYSASVSGTSVACLISSTTNFSTSLVTSASGASATNSATAVTAPIPTGGGGGSQLDTGNAAYPTVAGSGGQYSAAAFSSHVFSGSLLGGVGGNCSSIGSPTDGHAGGCVFWFSGTGGGGGACAVPAANGGVSAPGAKGGDGGLYGGGGGGGGASENGFASGAGGKGGDGIVIIITHF